MIKLKKTTNFILNNLGGKYMPGYLYHLLFAKKVYERLTSYIELDELNFFSGNLIPDLALNKERSH